MMGNQWATMDTVLPEADSHIRGTIPRSSGRTEFWLTAPRPKYVSIEEWDRVQEEKWNRILGKKE